MPGTKLTALGSIPEEWEVCPIGSFAIAAQYGLSVRGERTGTYPILRMNCQVDGRVVLNDLQYVDLDQGTFEVFRLAPGDILFNRTNSYELVGRSALYGHELPAVFASYLVRLRVDRTRVDPAYLNFLLNWDVAQRELKKLASRGVSQANISASKLKDFDVHLPSPREQSEIASALESVKELVLRESDLIRATGAIKQNLLSELFRHGLRGETQKETEIGLLPESWDTSTIDLSAEIISTRMPYGALLRAPDIDDNPRSTRVLGIKVADMNSVGPETPIQKSELERNLNSDEVRRRCAPPGTIVFPKNGAAVATNKKRIVAHWSVFDPNVMGLIARENLSQRYLFHWMQGFDLATIVSPGPVPHFNKSDLARVRLPVPPTHDEQNEIASIFDAIDRKIHLHKQKRAALEELFKALLHRLMIGEIRVSELDLLALQPRAVAETAA